jgi:hypothetical protein
LSFFLDEKERKNQDVAKLPPHLAERWPAATSAQRALLVGHLKSKKVFEKVLVKSRILALLKVNYKSRTLKGSNILAVGEARGTMAVTHGKKEKVH